MLSAIFLTSLMSNPIQFEGEMHDYYDGQTVLHGYVSKPKQDVVAPIVIIVHQWTGLSDYEKMRADMLAKMGYVAFALDIYGDEMPASGQRNQLAGKYKGDRNLFRQRLLAGFSEARKIPGANPAKIAAIGYCFGGTGVLELARAGADVRGVVSFHGGLDSLNKADGANIKGRVLVCHGADDPTISEDQMKAFTSEMKDNKVKWELISYGGAVHSFTDPKAVPGNATAAYNATADKRSWQSMTDFLREIFQD